MGRGFSPSLGGWPGNVNLFPAEKPSIDGPRPRTDHGQSRAKRDKHDAHPRVGRMGCQDDQLGNGNYHSCDRCPQAKEQQDSGSRCEGVRNDGCERRCSTHIQECGAKENGSG